MELMTLRYGIDTSVLVRFLTGLPASEYERCHRVLSRMAGEGNAEIYASNQVIGEAYIAVQHHYGISKAEAKSGLLVVLRSFLQEG